MIVDVHCHAGKGDGLTGPWDTNAPLEAYLARARDVGITHTVLLAAFHSDYAVANRNLAALVRRTPDRLWGFCFVHAARDKGRVSRMVERAVVDYGFIGIKVHRQDASITREICEAALCHQLPILYDVTGEVAQVELLASEYPRVNFIIPHLGSFSDDWKAQMGLIACLERHPNVYTDTAGVRRFDILEQAVQRASAAKVLFGSDGPWLHPAVELEKVYALGLSAKDEQRVLSGNFLKLTKHARRRWAHRQGRLRHSNAVGLVAAEGLYP